jgi:hypothetical protein
LALVSNSLHFIASVIQLFLQNNGAFGMYSGLRNPLKLISSVTPVRAIATALVFHSCLAELN